MSGKLRSVGGSAQFGTSPSPAGLWCPFVCQTRQASRHLAHSHPCRHSVPLSLEQVHSADEGCHSHLRVMPGHKLWWHSYSILSCPVLFYYFLFCSILFFPVIICSFLLYSYFFYFILFCVFMFFYSNLFYSFQFFSVIFCYNLLCFILLTKPGSPHENSHRSWNVVKKKERKFFVLFYYFFSFRFILNLFFSVLFQSI